MKNAGSSHDVVETKGQAKGVFVSAVMFMKTQVDTQLTSLPLCL
jgi:hypothetical protein